MNWWQLLLSAVVGGAITYLITYQKFNYHMRGIYFAEKKKALEDVIKNITEVMRVLYLIGRLDNKQPGALGYDELISQYNDIVSVSYVMIGRLGLYCDRDILKEIVNLYDKLTDYLDNPEELAKFSGEDQEGWDKFRNEVIYSKLGLLREELKKTVGVKV